MSVSAGSFRALKARMLGVARSEDDCVLHPHIREWPGTPEAGRGGGERTHATEEHNRGVINRRDE